MRLANRQVIAELTQWQKVEAKPPKGNMLQKTGSECDKKWLKRVMADTLSQVTRDYVTLKGKAGESDVAC